MATTHPAARADVLRTQAWPGGVCPFHMFGEARCNSWCFPTRLEFAKAARDLEAYWPIWDRRQARLARRSTTAA